MLINTSVALFLSAEWPKEKMMSRTQRRWRGIKLSKEDEKEKNKLKGTRRNEGKRE